jgi:hypothetical protein
MLKVGLLAKLPASTATAERTFSSLYEDSLPVECNGSGQANDWLYIQCHDKVAVSLIHKQVITEQAGKGLVRLQLGNIYLASKSFGSLII